jgi:hypothetical protein
VEDLVPVELKVVEALVQIHRIQLLSQLRLLNLPVGLLINFNVEHLTQGVKRIVNAKYKTSEGSRVPGSGPADPTTVEDRQT